MERQKAIRKIQEIVGQDLRKLADKKAMKSDKYFSPIIIPIKNSIIINASA